MKLLLNSVPVLFPNYCNPYICLLAVLNSVPFLRNIDGNWLFHVFHFMLCRRHEIFVSFISCSVTSFLRYCIFFHRSISIWLSFFPGMKRPFMGRSNISKQILGSFFLQIANSACVICLAANNNFWKFNMSWHHDYCSCFFLSSKNAFTTSEFCVFVK